MPEDVRLGGVALELRKEAEEARPLLGRARVGGVPSAVQPALVADAPAAVIVAAHVGADPIQRAAGDDLA